MGQPIQVSRKGKASPLEAGRGKEFPACEPEKGHCGGCEAIRMASGLNRVALSGGVFQNMILLTSVTRGLRDSGFEVYTHQLVPTNDGCISLGQAVIGHMRLFESL